MKRLQTYQGPGFTVTFEPDVCIHSAVCLAALPAVFDVQRARWINTKAANAEEILAAVRKCPSGALRFIPEGPGQG